MARLEIPVHITVPPKGVVMVVVLVDILATEAVEMGVLALVESLTFRVAAQ
jgi:hypothetical protein